MRTGGLIAALACLAFSTPDANALTAIDTTGKTATEVMQISARSEPSHLCRTRLSAMN